MWGSWPETSPPRFWEKFKTICIIMIVYNDSYILHIMSGHIPAGMGQAKKKP